MTLEREQLLELRLADGIASPEERAAAAEAEVDEQELRMVRAVVAQALAAPPLTRSGEVPFADGVLHAVGGSDAAVLAAIRSALQPGSHPSIARSVLEEAGIPDVQPDVGAAVRAEAGRAPVLAGGVLDRTHPDRDASLEAVPGALQQSAAPGIAKAVLDRTIAEESDVGEWVRASLGVPVVPSLASSVMDELGIARGDADVADALLAGAGPVPAIADEVMRAVASGAAVPGIADAIGASAGPAPRLWDSIADEIGAPAANEPASLQHGSEEKGRETTVVELPARRRWWVPTAGLAAAAAAAVFAVVGLPTERASDGQGDLAAHIHLEAGRSDIEEISAGPEAMVQVLQFEEDAPTIIFIDELEEPVGAEGEEGVPL